MSGHSACEENLAKTLCRLRSIPSLRLLILAMAVALCLSGASNASPIDDSLIVSTSAGQIRGVTRSSGGAEFLAIPYAQPPVGHLRWHQPIPPKSWTGVRDARAFGAPCPQPVLGGEWNKHDADNSKEDCLFLNVITPSWPPKKPLPVMVWIHGGANIGGSASSSLYKDGTLVQHGVIVVTVNYRLGIFGFFAHPELTRESPHHASGNYGLMDQLLALQWVHGNIAKFGGDPGNVTLFGQSAGAQDTGLLMTSPLSKDLFQRAIAQSGSALIPPLAALADTEKTGEEIALALKAPAGTGAIKALRQLSVSEIMSGLPKQEPNQPPQLRPNIDGWLIRRSPAEVFASGQESSVPLIVGTTTREFGMSASPDELRKMIQSDTGNFSPQALSLYGLADGGQGTADPLYGSAADQWIADLVFRCPISTQAAWHSAAHHPTYEYELQHAIPGQEAQGAVHSADLPYVFGFYPKTGNISGNFGETDYKLADLIETYWTNFAKTGNPNGEKLPQWPEFDGSQPLIEFQQDGQVVTNSKGLRPRQCSLYREVLKERMKAAK
jgi:para-nitrobenzyl esterase